MQLWAAASDWQLPSVSGVSFPHSWTCWQLVDTSARTTPHHSAAFLFLLIAWFSVEVLLLLVDHTELYCESSLFRFYPERGSDLAEILFCASCSASLGCFASLCGRLTDFPTENTACGPASVLRVTSTTEGLLCSHWFNLKRVVVNHWNERNN